VKRIFDIIVSLMGIIVLFIPMLPVVILIKITSKGPVVYWSKRVGTNNTIFFMPKFRTMKIETPVVATHLMSDPEKYITPIGKYLRKTSIDELPQLLSVLKGDMSIVGPRPALYNQNDLIALRTEKGVHVLKPGLTGLSQVNGRADMSNQEKVDYDESYLNNISLMGDLKIIYKTISSVLSADGILH